MQLQQLPAAEIDHLRIEEERETSESWSRDVDLIHERFFFHSTPLTRAFFAILLARKPGNAIDIRTHFDSFAPIDDIINRVNRRVPNLIILTRNAISLNPDCADQLLNPPPSKPTVNPEILTVKSQTFFRARTAQIPSAASKTKIEVRKKALTDKKPPQKKKNRAPKEPISLEAVSRKLLQAFDQDPLALEVKTIQPSDYLHAYLYSLLGGTLRDRPILILAQLILNERPIPWSKFQKDCSATTNLYWGFNIYSDLLKQELDKLSEKFPDVIIIEENEDEEDEVSIDLAKFLNHTTPDTIDERVVLYYAGIRERGAWVKRRNNFLCKIVGDKGNLYSMLCLLFKESPLGYSGLSDNFFANLQRELDPRIIQTNEEGRFSIAPQLLDHLGGPIIQNEEDLRDHFSKAGEHVVLPHLGSLMISPADSMISIHQGLQTETTDPDTDEIEEEDSSYEPEDLFLDLAKKLAEY